MIVDDEHDFREMLDLMMKKEGFETETAEDGFDFLYKVDSFKPDLVTLDVNMPGLTTNEILEKLKQKKYKLRDMKTGKEEMLAVKDVCKKLK